MIKKKFAVRRRIHTHNPCMVIIIPYTHATWNQPPMSAYSVRTTTYFKNRYSSTAHSFRSESQTNRANPTTTTFQHPTNYKDSKMNYYWLKKFSVIVFRIYDRHNKNRVDKKKKKKLLCCFSVGVDGNCFEETFQNGSEALEKAWKLWWLYVTCKGVPLGFEAVEEIETEVRHVRMRWREDEEREGLGFGEIVTEEDERVTNWIFLLCSSLCIDVINQLRLPLVSCNMWVFAVVAVDGMLPRVALRKPLINIFVLNTY